VPLQQPGAVHPAFAGACQHRFRKLDAGHVIAGPHERRGKPAGAAAQLEYGPALIRSQLQVEGNVITVSLVLEVVNVRCLVQVAPLPARIPASSWLTSLSAAPGAGIVSSRRAERRSSSCRSARAARTSRATLSGVSMPFTSVIRLSPENWFGS